MENSTLVGSKPSSDLFSRFLGNSPAKNVKMVGIVLGAVFLGSLASLKVAQRLEKHKHPLAKNKWLVNGVAIACSALITKIALSLFRINHRLDMVIVNSIPWHFVARDLYARYQLRQKALQILKNSILPESLLDVVIVIYKVMKMRKGSKSTIESILKESNFLLTTYKNDPRMLGWIYMERGLALATKKNLPEAIEAYSNSLKYAQADDTNIIEYCALYERSQCLNELGQRKEAIQEIEKSIELAEKHQVKRRDERLSQMYNRLARFLIDDNQLDKALENLHYGISSLVHVEIAVAKQLIAEIHLKQHKAEIAIVYAKQALQIYQKLYPESLKVAAAQVFCAQIALENNLNEKDEAAGWYSSAKAIFFAKKYNHPIIKEIDSVLSRIPQSK